MDMRHHIVKSHFLIIGLFIMSSAGWGMEDPPNDKHSKIGSPKRFDRSCLVMPETVVDEPSTNPPSKAAAFFLSFVLPGAGEYYAGSKKMARIFFATEVILWATFASFRTYGNWKREDYQRFATVHAGVDPSGKDYQYFVDVENYMDIRAYNEAKLQQRDVNALYPENEEYSWQWDSEASKERYEALRLDSDNAFTRSLFIIGGIVVNHIISGIDALRIARKHDLTPKNHVQLGIAGLPEGGAVFTIWKCF